MNRSLQTLLENDTLWKDAMERRVQQLEEQLIAAGARNLSGESSLNSHHVTRERRNTVDLTSPQPQQITVPDQSHGDGPANQSEVVMDLQSNPSTIPGFYIASTPVTRDIPGDDKDIIAQGLVSLENAQRYFHTYRDRLDHFPYRILGNHSGSSLQDIRKSSSLLTLAILTVGALHLATDDFKVCYREFISMSGTRSLSRIFTIDDIRALCIGAFWLSDLSWTLASAAVRMATEVQLHKSIYRAIQGDREHYFKARLYLLVYACDHHFSIPFGRPPLTRECEGIRNVRQFLKCQHATSDDARLVSQVLRWSLCSNMYDAFDFDYSMPLPESRISRFRKFSVALDKLRDEWSNSFDPSQHVGNYPRKGVFLQYYFAKLYLCSHALRGSQNGDASTRSEESAMELDEFAHLAVSSALAIVRSVVSDPEVHSFLDGLPVYFDTMIAFAVIFLVKIVKNKYSISVRPDPEEVYQLLVTLSTTLNAVCLKMHPQHILVKIAKGIDRIIHQPSQQADIPRSQQPDESAVQAREPQISTDINLASESFGLTPEDNPDFYFIGQYDLLLNQDFGFNFDFAQQGNTGVL